MPNVHVLFRSQAREKVLRGAAALADAVRVTLGPKSRSVLIEKLENVQTSDLGVARRVVVARETTTIVGGAGKRGAIDARIAEIRRAKDKATSDYDKEKLQERPAKLAGGVAVVRVDAPTEPEMKSRTEATITEVREKKPARSEPDLGE